jgi:hypothetical protein
MPAPFALALDCLATVFTASFDGAGVTFPVLAARAAVARAEASPLGLLGGRGATSGSLCGTIAASGLIASVARSCGVPNVETTADRSGGFGSGTSAATAGMVVSAGFVEAATSRGWMGLVDDPSPGEGI